MSAIPKSAVYMYTLPRLNDIHSITRILFFAHLTSGMYSEVLLNFENSFSVRAAFLASIRKSISIGRFSLTSRASQANSNAGKRRSTQATAKFTVLRLGGGGSA